MDIATVAVQSRGMSCWGVYKAIDVWWWCCQLRDGSHKALSAASLHGQLIRSSHPCSVPLHTHGHLPFHLQASKQARNPNFWSRLQRSQVANPCVNPGKNRTAACLHCLHGTRASWAHTRWESESERQLARESDISAKLSSRLLADAHGSFG